MLLNKANPGNCGHQFFIINNRSHFLKVRDTKKTFRVYSLCGVCFEPILGIVMVEKMLFLMVFITMVTCKGKTDQYHWMNAARQSHVNIRGTIYIEVFSIFFYLLRIFFFFKYQQTKNLVLKN